MKLLFDNNLSYHLVMILADLYPGSEHVRSISQMPATDDRIWRYARLHSLVIVSKDSDFYRRSRTLGHPPKVVWLQIGNCPVAQIEMILRIHYDTLLTFEQDVSASCLILS